MAIGFTPKYIEDVPLYDLTKQQFLVLATETANTIGWEISYISDNGFIAAAVVKGIVPINLEITIKIADGIANIKSELKDEGWTDLGKNKKNIANFISNLNEIKPTLTKDVLDAKYKDINEQFVSEVDDILMLPPPSTSAQYKSYFKDFLIIFTPSQDYFFTPVLLNLNILIFILMAISGVDILQPDNLSLLNWGANYRPMTLEGEWWRLITSCFLHIGIIHLLVNMYALFNIGVLLEPLLGRKSFILIYLLLGITASMASIWWSNLSISAGASGAIFGMYGVFLAMLTTSLIDKTVRKPLLISIAIFIFSNLLEGLKDNGTDNAAHIGGLLGGIVVGYALIPSLKKPHENKLKVVTITMLTILILVSSTVVYIKLPNDIGTYDAKIKEFVSMEAKALEIYNLPPDTPNDKLLYSIKDKGIYYWKENIKLLNSFKKLDLPLEINTKNELLIEYCELRIKSYELLYKAVSEDTDQYQLKIEDYNRQIELKIKEISGEQQTQ